MSTTQDAEITAGDDSIVVPLAGTDLRVLPLRKWKASAVRAMKDGDFDRWAEKALDGDYPAWQAIDPDMDQVEVFFTAWALASGQSPKGSPTSSGS